MKWLLLGWFAFDALLVLVFWIRGRQRQPKARKGARRVWVEDRTGPLVAYRECLACRPHTYGLNHICGKEAKPC